MFNCRISLVDEGWQPHTWKAFVRITTNLRAPGTSDQDGLTLSRP